METTYPDEIVEALLDGAVGVIPTDTQYGIVARALDPDAVERVYELRQRDAEKPFIVLISSIDDLEQFGIVVDADMRDTLERYWPGPVSLVLLCEDEQFSYLHRDKYTLAFRVPDNVALQDLLVQTGPLIAPSANVQGESPAKTVDEARRYFGTDAAFYVDGGILNNPPSKLIDLTLPHPVVLRDR